jgi:carboxylate-amine ligase
MERKRRLKRAKLGLELEFFLIDEDGFIANRADDVLRKLRKLDTTFSFRREVSKSMIEMNGFPRRRVEKAAKGVLDNIELLNETVRKLDLYLLPTGTYPGNFYPSVRKTGWYHAKALTYGKNRLVKESYCCGVHMHYSLPRGVLDKKNNVLRHMANSRITDALIYEHNLILALDPVITTILQSSPLYNGFHLGKDSRVLMYRDIKFEKFGKNWEGAFNDLSKFGGFPHYMHTIEDLNQKILGRYDTWINMMKGRGCYPEKSIRTKKPLDFFWGPLRINKVGSFEHRGLDMNYPKYIIGVSVLMKALLRRIHRDYLKVVPSDIAIDTPLKIEGDTIYIPPFSKVRNDLQLRAAFKGLADPEVYNYAKRFLRLAQANMKEKYNPTVIAVKNMIEKRKTVSDRIIDMIKRKGYSFDEPVPNDICAEIAVKLGARMEKEIDVAKKAAAITDL